MKTDACVVAALLRDFLRELPIPLLAPDVERALVSAAGKRLYLSKQAHTRTHARTHTHSTYYTFILMLFNRN